MPTINGVTTAMPAPDGYVVDFDNPQRTGVPELYIITALGGVLAFIFFVQRLYVKLFLSSGLQLDDYLLIIGVLLIFAVSALILDQFLRGFAGVHSWEISLDQYNDFLLHSYIGGFLYPACGSFAKLSLLVFYLQLSPQRWFKIATWASIVTIICYTLAINIPLVFACQPISKSWDATITHGSCLNMQSLYIATAVSNIASDVVLFFLPLPMVIGLHIPFRQKIGLTIIFGIGSVTLITSIVRVVILVQSFGSTDGPWTLGIVSIWVQVEGFLIIIICASLPTLRKFTRHFAPKLLGDSRYGSKTKTTENSKQARRSTVPHSQSRRDRCQYSQFDVEEGHVTIETYVMGPLSRNKDSNRAEGSAAADLRHDWADTDSEKAIIAKSNPKGIIHTTVVSVDVEYRRDEEQNK